MRMKCTEVTDGKPGNKSDKGTTTSTESEKSKKARKKPKARGPPPEGVDSYTISQWCWIRNVSRTTYYRMKKQHRNPREIRVLGRRMITKQADREWVEARAAEALIAAE